MVRSCSCGASARRRRCHPPSRQVAETVSAANPASVSSFNQSAAQHGHSLAAPQRQRPPAWADAAMTHPTGRPVLVPLHANQPSWPGSFCWLGRGSPVHVLLAAPHRRRTQHSLRATGSALWLRPFRTACICGLPAAPRGGLILCAPAAPPLPPASAPCAPTLNPDARLQRAPPEDPHPRARGVTGNCCPLPTCGPAPATPNDRPTTPTNHPPWVLFWSPRSLSARLGRSHKP